MISRTRLAGVLLLASTISATTLDVPVVYGVPCTREKLQKIAKNYIESSGAYPDIVSVIDMSLDSQVSQNNVKRDGPLDTAISNIISFSNKFQIQALDVETCNVATVYVPNEFIRNGDSNEGQNITAITSIRIQMNPEYENIEQLEIINALPGSHATFAPESLPKTAPAAWAENQTASPRLTRNQLIKLVDSYPTAIAAGSGAQIAVTSSCVRYENGAKTSSACNAVGDSHDPVVSRRWVADADTGVVLGMYFVDKQKAQGAAAPSLELHEYFKVVGNQIGEIMAVTRDFPGAIKDFWSGAATSTNAATLRYNSVGSTEPKLIHHKRWTA